MRKNTFNLQKPVIQAPMAGGILSPEFTATVCNSGCLGFVAGGYLSIEDLEKNIQIVKNKINTKQTLFGVNIFIEPERTQEQILLKSKLVQELESELQLELNDSFIVPRNASENELIELLIDLNVPIASATFGFFSKENVDKLKNHGIKIIGNATSINEVIFCKNNGADAIVLQGYEAGGHQARFLSDDLNNLGSLELLKLIMAYDLEVVIIAAGGISSCNYKNYLSCGANYVQLGSAFMLTQESNVSQIIKEYIRLSNPKTNLTQNITGKWARGINNKLFDKLTEISYDFPIQHYLTARLRQEAKKQNNLDYQAIWLGDNPDNLHSLSLIDLINSFENH